VFGYVYDLKALDLYLLYFKVIEVFERWQFLRVNRYVLVHMCMKDILNVFVKNGLKRVLYGFENLNKRSIAFMGTNTILLFIKG